MMYKRLYAEMFVKGITRKDLAELLNISEKAVSDKLRGKDDFCYLDMVNIINTYFKGQSYDYIFSSEA